MCSVTSCTFAMASASGSRVSAGKCPVLFIGKSHALPLVTPEFPVAMQPQGKSGQRCMDSIFEEVSKAGVTKEQCYVLTDALHYKNYERWAVSHGLGVDHVINSGRTLADSR